MTKLSSVLSLVLVLALAACGSDDEPKTTGASKTPTPAGTPFPTGDMWPLQSGVTYTTRKYQPSLGDIRAPAVTVLRVSPGARGGIFAHTEVERVLRP